MRSVVAGLALLVLGQSGVAGEVRIDNGLSHCVTLRVTGTAVQGNLLLAAVVAQVSRPIGECGCLSALGRYTASVNRAGSRQVLQEGVLGLRGSADKTLVLASEPALVKDKGVTISLACSGPQ